VHKVAYPRMFLSTIFKILNCWFFNVVLIVCYFLNHCCFCFLIWFLEYGCIQIVIFDSLMFLVLNLLFVLNQNE